ncbi:TerB N-terminal domain-containing protein [Sporofaciens sp. SGI.106]|uniref:TerB N-terminal domain-containing protein n=1 Tax=Sporofaciens sp. SGI.106 TaxID=3420568 RepID=UPI003D056FF7
MRYVDENNIEKMYNELQKSLKKNQLYDGIAILGMKDPTNYYKVTKKYEDVCWNGCEVNKVKFMTYPATYADMDMLQFTYFMYWRTKALSGNVICCHDSYVYIYVCELLAGFHATSSEEGYQLLRSVYRAYSGFDKSFEKHLIKWILGYCIIHGIYDAKREELDVITEDEYNTWIQKKKLLNNDYSKCFDVVLAASDYKLDKQSAFYKSKQGTRVIDMVFDAAMTAINECMRQHKLVLSDYIIGKGVREKWRIYDDTPWEGYLGLISSSIKYDKTFIFRRITYEYSKHEKAWYYDAISEYEHIICGKYFPRIGYKYHDGKFVAYVVETIEAICRNKVGYQYKLKPDYVNILGTRGIQKLVESGEIGYVVEKVVDDFAKKYQSEFAELPRKKPEIKTTKRKNLKLVKKTDESKAVVEDVKIESESAMINNKISTEEIEKARQVLFHNQEKLVLEGEYQEESAISEKIQETIYSKVQVHILKLLINKEYAAMEEYVSQKVCNVILEVEKINKIAMEELGDILVDNDGSNYFVYEEYADYIEGL